MALRRPAAVKAAAKDAVRVRGVLRRPARAEEERDPGVRGENLEDRFIAGELVEASKVPLGRLTQGTLLLCEGEYWGAPCKVCGVIRSLKIKGASDVELAVKAEGTDHEDLLKWNSENPEAAIRVHLCGGACPAKIEAKDLIHAQKVRLKTREDEGGWTENMKGSLDELAALRRDKAAPGPEREERERAQKADGKEREKKKKKKKKAKRSRSTSETSQTREKKTPKKKVESQKSLSQVFGTTALDPDPKVRRRLLKRVKRKMRKKKDESSPKQWELLGGELEGIELGEQRIWPALRGQSQGEEHQPEGPGRIDLWYGQGDAASAAHIGGHGLGEGPVGGTANSLAVLQESAFQQADRRSCSGGLDVELGPRPSIARESGQSGRLLVSAAEEHRDERRRHKLDGSPAGGGVAPREGPPIESRRSASCGQRKQGRVEGKEFGQRKGKGQERQRLPRMAPRRKRGAEGEGQRKEQERKRQRGREERLLDKGAAEGKSPEKEALLEEHKGVEKEKLLRRGVSEEKREEDQSLLKTTKGVKTGLSYQDDPCGPFEIQGMSRMTLTPGEAGFLSTDAAGGARPTTSAQFSNKEDGTTLEDGCCGNAAALAAASPSMVGFRRSPLGAAEDCFRAGGPEKDARSRDEGSGEGQFSKELGGCKFSAVSPLLRSLLISTEKELKFRRGETQTTGDVFPLPTNIDLLRGVGKLDEDALLLLSCVCLGLNSYAGTALESSAPLSKVQKFFLEGFVASVEDVMGWSEVFGDISWQSFFQLKSLDYVGDEVATARVTSWANLQSAIPVEVGSVPLSQVVGPGCAHYVDHFEDFLLDEKSRTYTRPPKVMVTEHDWDGVCEGLNYLGWNMWSHGRK